MNHRKLHRRFLDSSGMSLIEVAIASGIMVIGMLAFSTMTQNQQKETKALSDKMAALDLEKLVIATLADGSVCKFIFTDPSQSGNRSKQTFNSSDPSDSISFNQIPASNNPSGAPFVAKVGELASPISRSVKVQAIQANVVSGSGDQFIANLSVAFSGTIRPIKPAVVQLMLFTDPASKPTEKKILDCAATGGSGVTTKYAEYSTAGTYSWVAPAGVTSVYVKLLGGGGGGGDDWGGGSSANGGAGEYAEGVIDVTAGQSYRIVVSAGLKHGHDTTEQWAGSSSFESPTKVHIFGKTLSSWNVFSAKGGSSGNGHDQFGSGGAGGSDGVAHQVVRRHGKDRGAAYSLSTCASYYTSSLENGGVSYEKCGGATDGKPGFVWMSWVEPN